MAPAGIAACRKPRLPIEAANPPGLPPRYTTNSGWVDLGFRDFVGSSSGIPRPGRLALRIFTTRLHNKAAIDGNRMMAVSAPAGDSLSHGRPLPLFEGLYLPSSDEHRNYDVSRDGQRFIMVKGVGGGGMLINAVFNWFEELERLVPLGK